jgi:hypothetical protein
MGLTLPPDDPQNPMRILKYGRKIIPGTGFTVLDTGKVFVTDLA